MKGKKSVLLKKWLNPMKAMGWAADSEKLGFRRKALPVWTIKKDGFDQEYSQNTDGFCEFIDFLYNYYSSREELSSAKISILREKIFEIEKQLKEVGIWDLLKVKVQALEEEVKKL